MNILSELLGSLQDAPVEAVRIGLRWTAVVVGAGENRRCGLAATLQGAAEAHPAYRVAEPGTLEKHSGLELAAYALQNPGPQTSVGVAAINALVPHQLQTWQEGNAEALLAELGQDKSVVVVGDFPFTDRLAKQVGDLAVIDRQPREGIYPESAAADLLPKAGVVAITAMTLINHSLEGLLQLCPPEAHLLLLGPSTPLSPLLFNYGFDYLSGSVVTRLDPVLAALCQGANFRQLHKAGVRLVNLARPAEYGQ